jgi:hypothetical protein
MTAQTQFCLWGKSSIPLKHEFWFHVASVSSQNWFGFLG